MKNGIKIFLPFPENSQSCRGESVWAERLTENTARIDNYPVGKDAHGIQYNDVVEFTTSTLPTSAEFTIKKKL